MNPPAAGRRLALAWRQLRRYKLAMAGRHHPRHHVRGDDVRAVPRRRTRSITPTANCSTRRRSASISSTPAAAGTSGRSCTRTASSIRRSPRTDRTRPARTTSASSSGASPYRLFWLIPTDVHLLGVDPPARLFLLGTDQFGRDLCSRLLYGSRDLALIGLLVVVITFPIGMMLGGDRRILRRRGSTTSSCGASRCWRRFRLLPAAHARLGAAADALERRATVHDLRRCSAWSDGAGWRASSAGIVFGIREVEFVLAARAAGLSGPQGGDRAARAAEHRRRTSSWASP